MIPLIDDVSDTGAPQVMIELISDGSHYSGGEAPTETTGWDESTHTKKEVKATDIEVEMVRRIKFEELGD